MAGSGSGWRAFLHLAAAQHGVADAGQAAGAGLSNRVLRQAVDAGRLRRVRRGVYAVAGPPPSPWEEAAAVALVGGALALPGRDAVRSGGVGAGPGGRSGGTAGGAALSHWTAAAVHRLPGLHAPPGQDLTVVGDRRLRLEGVRVHRVRDLARSDLVVRAGLVVTTPARTFVDLAAHLERPLLERILDEGHLLRLWSFGEVLACLTRRSGRGHPGCGVVRELLQPRLGSLAADSALERHVVRVLAPFGPFVTHHQVVLDGHVAVLDVAWPALKVAVEADGWAAHSRSRLTFDRDRRRGNLLAADGWLVAHVTSRMDDRTILQDVGRLLAARRDGARLGS